MELKRDEILKWWELCANDITCRKCPYEKVGNCQGELMQATLDIFKELTEENERLERICESYALQYGTATDKDVILAKERADTVRKMQDLIKVRCIKGGIYPAFVASAIDQIVKELIGETE